ncbi:hypothetical protein [Sphingomonas sp.]|uniref:hypothetical protein n=1 Tax=Sphingomonas sp. TaxID=28214 RepID=UPI0017B9AE53|nr:hypothetical protein [Sphingomonas sp.]MBA3511580.1 hypothetical protein [Sphingomonas sp.]
MPALRNHGRLWSASDIAELKSMVAQQIELREIAAQLGRTEEAVATKLYGLYGRHTTRVSGKRQQRRRNGASFFLS